MTLLGEIVEFEGMICLRTSPGCYYPLAGNSGIAADFVEAFNVPQPSDIGKQLHRVRGVLQMENTEQREARLS